MKSARKMFKELGYEYTTYWCGFKTILEYWSEEDTNNWKHIFFDFETKSYFADEHNELMYVDMKTFKAIQKQLEELGWLEE